MKLAELSDPHVLMDFVKGLHCADAALASCYAAFHVCALGMVCEIACDDTAGGCAMVCWTCVWLVSRCVAQIQSAELWVCTNGSLSKCGDNGALLSVNICQAVSAPVWLIAVHSGVTNFSFTSQQLGMCAPWV